MKHLGWVVASGVIICTLASGWAYTWIMFDRSKDRWTKKDHDAWIDRLREANPSLHIPKN